MPSPVSLLQLLGQGAAHLPGCGHMFWAPGAALAASAVLVLVSGVGASPNR